MATIPPDRISAIRLRVLENGYTPIPITAHDFQHPKVNSPGKQPFFKAWTEVSADTVTPDIVRGWPQTIRNHPNTGLLCGRLIGVDIDALDPALSADLQAMAVSLLGTTPLRRVGRAPKMLFCYRLQAPMRKQETPELHMPDGTVAQVEVLAQGQQFVAYGTHPDTGLEYEWPDAGPDVVPFEDLPETDAERIGTFLVAAQAIIRRAGGRTKKEIEREAETAAQPQVQPRPFQPQQGRDAGSTSDFFRQVNDRALRDAGVWMQAVFGAKAKRQDGTGAWRVSSEDLGRSLEEDLSVHPDEGAMDWGTRKGVTPIDIVMEWGGSPTPKDAAFYLCERLGVDAGSLGWRQGTKPQAQDDQDGRFDVPPPVEERAGRTQPRERQSDWPDPIDFLADDEMTGAPQLLPEHLPGDLYAYAIDVARRMGVDPATVALAALVSCASVLTDDWQLQVKQHDTGWKESPRIWGAIVGDPSIKKSPVLAACTRPIERMQGEARKAHAEAMKKHKVDVKAWKDAKGEECDKPVPPRAIRYLVEAATMEALSEVLRDDEEAKYRAPAKKVLVRQDEMSEWVAGFDRYGSGKGGADKGGWLRLYNGGSFSVDRIMRGSFHVPNWSACFIGGIQPEPIRRIAQEAEADGLLQRFIYCVPGRELPEEDRAPDQRIVQGYEDLLHALSALRPAQSQFGNASRPVVMSEGAHQHRKMINEQARAMANLPDTATRMKAAFGKWPGLYARLTLLFHLVETAHLGANAPPVQVVREETAQKAAAYMISILLPHLLRADSVMFSTVQTGHAAWIAKHILAKAEPLITLRDLTRAYGALRAPEKRRELLEVMQAIETMGWIRNPDFEPGRTPTRWEVNPKVLEAFAERGKIERERRDRAQAEVREIIRTRPRV